MKKYERNLEEIIELNPDAIRLDGLDECIAGLVNCFDGVRILYSERKIIEHLRDDMTEEEAWEYYEYNILGGYFGTYNPVFLMDYYDEDEEEK